MASRQKDNTLSILGHVLGIFVGFIAPLIILLVAKDGNTKRHAKVALNWQISLIIYFVVSMILTIILIGFLFLIVLVILNIVFPIIAAVRASEGKLWYYPLAIKFFNVK